MNNPQRIQRKRVSGWKMPDGAVYVGRGSKYGNPYRVQLVGPGEERLTGNAIFTPEQAVGHFRKFVDFINANAYRFPESPLLHANLKRELGGKVLACWCATDQACHADVLLELANREE